MKKLAALTSGLTYLWLTATTFAQTTAPGTIRITEPRLDGKRIGYTNINEFLNNIITLVFIVAVVALLVMLVWGAIQWIFSGGEKEAVGAARGRIINALIGIAILAVAFAIARLAGQFLGFDIFGTFTIPAPAP